MNDINMVSELDSPPADFPEDRVPTIVSALNHFLLHEAYHVGKISLLRRMLRLPSVAELHMEK
ncbi:MAG: hypothetical protein ACE5JA_08480 [bacterium]